MRFTASISPSLVMPLAAGVRPRRPISMPTIAFLNATTADRRVLVPDDVTVRLPVPIIRLGQDKPCGFLHSLTVIRDRDERLGESVISGEGFVDRDLSLDGHLWPILQVEDVMREDFGDVAVFKEWRVACVYLSVTHPWPTSSEQPDAGGLLLPVTVGE